MTGPEALREARRDAAAALAATLFLTLGVTAGVLVVPLYDMHLFDRVLVGRSLDTLVVLSIVCAIGVTVYGILFAVRGMLLAAVAERITRRLSLPAMAAATRRAVGGDTRAGGRALADLAELRAFFGSGAAAAPLDLVLAPVLLLALWLLHPALFWIGLAMVLALVAWAALADALVRPAVDAAQARLEQALLRTQAALRDPVLTDALGCADAVGERWRAAHRQTEAAQRTATWRGEAVGGGARGVRGLLQGCVIALATLLVLRHELTPGALAGANLLVALLLAPLDQVLAQWRSFAGARLAWARLVALLGEVPRRAAETGGFAGIRFSDVTLRPDRSLPPILSRVSLTVRPGEVVALVGPNGAGKSSLARLAAGVLEPSEGRVESAGADATAAASAGRIGYLPQRTLLLEATVGESIARFRDAPSAAVVAASRAAGLHPVVGRLPRGYATPITPGGQRLSGGEQQRLALARALFGDPAVVVLDEPDASLDGGGEDHLVEAVTGAARLGAAVLLVTHRQRLLRAADRVVRVEAGCVVPQAGRGTP